MLLPGAAWADNEQGGDRSEASMTIEVECHSIEVTSSKDISHVEVFFVDGTSQEINVNQPTYSQTFANAISHAEAKSGQTTVTDTAGSCTQPASDDDDDDKDDKDDDGDRDRERDDDGDEKDEPRGSDQDDDGKDDDPAPSNPGGGDSQGGNLSCPAGTRTFTINSNPGNGTFSDGTLTITIFNNDGDSFNWSANRSVHSVLIKGGPTTTVNSGGTSGFATTAFNPNSGQLYGISHVTICYVPDQVGGTPPTPPCDADATTPGIQPCGPDTKVCPPGSDFPGVPMDDLKDCFRDDVGGEVITRPVEVCPSGPFKGLPMTSPRDCVGPDDRVLPNVIRRDARPEVEAETTEAGGGVLPFTGAGAGSVLSLLITGFALIGSGTLAMRTRRKK